VLRSQTGRLEWRYSLAARYETLPAASAPQYATIDDGRVYTSGNGWLLCLDGATGQLLWKKNLPAEPASAAGRGRHADLWPLEFAADRGQPRRDTGGGSTGGPLARSCL